MSALVSPPRILELNPCPGYGLMRTLISASVLGLVLDSDFAFVGATETLPQRGVAASFLTCFPTLLALTFFS